MTAAESTTGMTFPPQWAASLFSLESAQASLHTPARGVRVETSKDLTLSLRTLLAQGWELSSSPGASFRVRQHGESDLAELATWLEWVSKHLWDSTGREHLQMTFGLVSSDENTEEKPLVPLRAPVVCVPVRLDRSSSDNTVYVRPAPSASLRINPALAQWFTQKHRLQIKLFAAPPVQDGIVDVNALIEGLGAALADLPYRIEPIVELSILDLPRTRLRQDLLKNSATWAKMPIVAALADPDTETIPAAHVPTEADLEDLLTRLPLPADSAQLRAVATAQTGASFAIDAGPGSGKRRTAVNILADGLSRGKRILVLAPSPTILADMQRRAERAGIGHICLNLATNNLTANTVRADLLRAWDQPLDSNPSFSEEMRKRLGRIRRDLNHYAEAIHKSGPLGISAWQAHTNEITAVKDLPREALHELAKVLIPAHFATDKKLGAAALKLADELEACLAELDEANLSRHPWLLIGPSPKLAKQEKFAEAVTNLERSVRACHPAVAELLATVNNFSTWGTIARWFDLLEVGYGRQPTPLPPAESRELFAEIDAIITAAEELDKFGSDSLEIGAKAYQAGKDIDLIRSVKEIELTRGFTRRSLRKAVASELQPYLEKSLNPSAACALVEKLSEIRVRAESLAEKVQNAPVLGLPDWDPLSPGALEKLKLHADTVTTAVILAAEMPEQVGMLTNLIDIGRDGGNLGDHVRRVATAWTELLDCTATRTTELDLWRAGKTPLKRYFEVAPVWASATGEGGYQQIVAMHRLRLLEQQADQLGIGTLIRFLTTGRISGAHAHSLMQYAFTGAVLHERIQAESLNAFDPERHEELLQAYLEISEALHQQTSLDMAASAAEVAMSSSTEAERRELTRQLRTSGGSVTKLFSSYGPAILCRTPAILATPDAVARYLPALNNIFDTVIVLGAEQLGTPETIGAIGRGRQLIVIGDSAQDCYSVVHPEMSLLSSTLAAGLTRLELPHHYRSQSAELMDYPNQAFYNSRILLPPSPPRGQSAPPPIEIVQHQQVRSPDFEDLTQIGIPANGLALQPARSPAPETIAGIAASIEQIRRRFPQDSFGVVTWHYETAFRVAAALQKRHGLNLMETKNPHREWEDFLCTDALHSGGMVRDVIVLVLSPWPSSSDKWGVATNEGTTAFSRVLATALARARKKLIVVCPPTPPVDIPQPLQSWLEYFTVEPEKPVLRLDLHRSEVAPYLREAGLEVKIDPTGSLWVDFAVRADAGSPWLAVSLDGPEWNSRTYLYDREILPRLELTERLGWGGLDYIWLAQWLTNRDESVRRIVSHALDLAFPPEILGSEETEESVPQKQAEAEAPRVERPYMPPPPVETQKVTGHPVNVGSSQQRRAFVTRDREQVLPVFVPPRVESHEVHKKAVSSSPGLPANVTPLPEPPRINREDIVVSNLPSLGETLAEYPERSWIHELGLDQPDEVHTVKSSAGFEPLFAETAVGVNAESRGEEATPAPAAVILPTALPQYGGINPISPEGAVISQLGEKEILDNLDNPQSAQLVAQALSEIAASEAPVGADRLGKLVAEAFGMQRLHPKRRDLILEMLPSNLQIISEKYGDFVWPTGANPGQYRSFKTGSVYGSRPLTAISTAELNNAIVWAVGANPGSDDERLLEIIPEVLDLSSVRTAMRARVKSGLSNLVQKGSLRKENQEYFLK